MPYTASQLTTFYTNANMGMTPSAAESLLIQAYAQQNTNGALTDAQTLNDVLSLSRDKTDVAVSTYEFFTGSTPTLAGLSYLVHGGGNANDLSSAYYANFNTENRYYNFAINLAFGGPNASSFASTYGNMTFDQAVASAYELIIGSANATAAGIDPAKAIASIEASLPYFQLVASERASTANQDLATKAIMIGYILEEAIKADVGTYAKGVDGFMGSLSTTGTATTGDLLTNYPATAAGQTVALTTGIDTVSLGNANDTVNGSATTFNSIDNLNGGGGNNVLNIVDTAAINPGTSETVTNFQTVNVTSGYVGSGGTPTSVVLNGSGFTGTTQFNVVSAGAATLTAIAATANATVSANSAASAGAGGNATTSVSGGNNVTLTDIGGIDTVSGAAAAVTLTDASQGGNNVKVDGGTNVTVTTTGNTGGSITVGSTTAPTGAVSVTDSATGGGANVAAGAIAVTGGTTVSVTQNLTGSATDVTKTVTAGAVTVTGTANTTSVSVSNTAAAAATAKVGAIVDNSATITDAGFAGNKAGTIASVSLSNVTGATINDNGLTTLSLAGDTNGGTVTINDNLAAPTVTSLNVTLNNFKGTLGDTAGELSTINFNTTGTGSTITALNDAGLTTLNVSGSSGGVTMTATPASIANLNVTGAAAFTGDISGTKVTSFAPTSTGTVTVTIDSTKQAFTGGAGTDVVTISGDAVKVVQAGSAGNNEIVLNETAATLATPANIKGFQTLGLGAAASGTYDMSKFTNDTFSSIDVKGDGGNVFLTKVAPGTSLSLAAGLGFAGSVTYQTSDTNGPTDQVGVTLGSATTAANQSIANGQPLTLEDSVLNGIGTVVLTSQAVAPTTGNNPWVDTLAQLNDTGLTSLTFAGSASTTVTNLVDNTNTVTIANAGAAGTLDTITGWTDNNLKSLTLSGNVALTLTDGYTSGVTVAGGSDNAGVTLNLAGAGATHTDTITLGTGANSITDGGTGTVNVSLAGATTGTDTVTIHNAAAATVTASAGANTIITDSAGVNSVTIGATGSKAESVAFGHGTNTATFGAHTGVDNVSVLATNVVNPGPAGFSLAAVVTGLNSSATTNDTITFGSDNAAAGAVTVVSTATINAYAAAHAADPTQLSTALNAVLDTVANSGAGLAQHQVAEFSFQGNTYIVEQGDVTGHTLANEAVNTLTVVELVGTVPVTGASSAAAGVLTLHG